MDKTKLDLFYNKIRQYHNPNLVKQDKDPTKDNYEENVSPNGNIIYHFYNDGEITYEKGAWAYLMRSRFTYSHAIPNLDVDSLDLTKFPNELSSRTRYCIVTKNHAVELRDLLLDIVNTQENQDK